MDKRRGLRASRDCLEYMLNKHRDNLMKQDNDRRATLLEEGMYTLQNIKDEYYTLLSNNELENRDFEKYLKENYVQVYDGNLNFIGYVKEYL